MVAASTTTTTTTTTSNVSYSRRDGLPVYPVPPQDLSLKMIRDAVPAHCFERSLLTSVKHVVLDLAMIFSMGFAIHFADNRGESFGVPRLLINWVLWPLYMWFQGAVMTGIWVLAHECGHQAFSPWKAVNDAFGLVLHSALLVPYHSWRITHSQHHKKTNHMTLDQVFVPSSRERYNDNHGVDHDKASGAYKYRSALMEALDETPLGDLFGIFQMWAVGWWAYLAANVASQPLGPGANHYNPKAPMFSKREYWDIVVSDIGVIAALGALAVAVSRFGFLDVGRYYFVPYMIVNMWLVTITYLQHSDPAVPHYKPEAFSFVRGALCSVDRDYGIYNVLHHHIGDTHVCHHLFSQMPFYHAQEATKAIKKVLGEYYAADNTPILTALRRSWAHCKFVDEKDGDVMFYRNYKMETLAAKKQ